MLGNWVLLRAGDSEFIVPQHDVVKTGYLQTQLVPDNQFKGVLCPTTQQTDDVVAPSLNITASSLQHGHQEEDIPLVMGSASKTQTLPAQEKNYYISLSPDLKVMNHCPKSRFLLTTFIGSDWQWCWDDVSVILDTELNMEHLPERLLASHTPVLGVVMLKDKPVFYTQAERIFKYVLWQVQS